MKKPLSFDQSKAYKVNRGKARIPVDLLVGEETLYVRNVDNVLVFVEPGLEKEGDIPVRTAHYVEIDFPDSERVLAEPQADPDRQIILTPL